MALSDEKGRGLAASNAGRGALPFEAAGAKPTFRALLAREAERLGLTATAIETLVERAQIAQWRKGARVCGPDEGLDLVHFVVSGAIKVLLHGPRRTPIAIEVLCPGQFLCLVPARPGCVVAVAQAPSVIAVLSRALVQVVVEDLPPGRLWQLLVHIRRAAARLLLEKCLLLAMPLRERVLLELVELARRFGRPLEAGTLIDLALRHADLAELVGGARANVSRAVAQLRHAGRIDVVGGRFVVPAASASQSHPPVSSVTRYRLTRVPSDTRPHSPNQRTDLERE